MVCYFDLIHQHAWPCVRPKSTRLQISYSISCHSVQSVTRTHPRYSSTLIKSVIERKLSERGRVIAIQNQSVRLPLAVIEWVIFGETLSLLDLHVLQHCLSLLPAVLGTNKRSQNNQLSDLTQDLNSAHEVTLKPKAAVRSFTSNGAWRQFHTRTVELCLPVKIESISRTAGSGEPKYSARFSIKEAAMFRVGGSGADWSFRDYVRQLGS